MPFQVRAYHRGQTFMGIPTMHSWAELCYLEGFINHYKINTIIELGTGMGGATALFAAAVKKRNGHVWTFNIKDELHPNTSKILKALDNSTAIIGDIFEKKLTELIIELLQDEKVGNTLLYCDNGNKTEEFDRFAGHIRDQQFIGVHDFASRGAVFMGYTIEITPNDIVEKCKEVLLYKVNDQGSGGGLAIFQRKL